MADNVQDIILREVVHPVLTTKNAELTLTEIDENFIAIFNDIVGLDNPGVVPAWDEDVIYNTTNLRYVSHDTFLWLSLQIANKGNTPQDPSAFWARVSVGQLAHEVNKDDTLDLGGGNEVTASEIKTHLDSNPQLGSVTDIVNAMDPPPGSPSEVDGRSYILDRDSLVFTPVSAVWQTGIKVKIDLSSGSPGPDFTDIEAGDFLCLEGFDNDVNNGSFPIDEVNAVDDFIVILNAGRTDGSLDENPAPVTAKAHSTHTDWDGGCRDDRVTYNAATDKWVKQTPTEGSRVYELDRELYLNFYGIDEGWIEGEQKRGSSSLDITGNNDDFDIGNGDFIKLSPQTAGPDELRGITNGWDGRMISIMNDSGANSLRIVDEAATSASANRIVIDPLFGSDLDIDPGKTIQFIYDDDKDTPANSRWRKLFV